MPTATPAFRLTYASMFDPPPALHHRFDEALARARARPADDLPMCIDGRDRGGDRWIELRSPIDHHWLLGRFPSGTAADADDAVTAALRAGPGWAATPYGERIAMLRRAAAMIEAQVFELSAALALEVGKNRMEALGEVQETADLISWYCDQMAEHAGFDRRLPNEPLTGFVSRNRTLLKPHGVWAVIAPFNFPLALAGGPIAAALVTGNTVVFKVASATAGSGRALMQVFQDAGLPAGVLNLVSGARVCAWCWAGCT
jgi:1-pyrroline-5-carboxylate dehydrogenase